MTPRELAQSRLTAYAVIRAAIAQDMDTGVLLINNTATHQPQARHDRPRHHGGRADLADAKRHRPVRGRGDERHHL